MILIDFSQCAIANISHFTDDLKKSKVNKEEAANIIRHAILSSIKHYKHKYHKEYGEIVIACDGRNYWRKEVFPLYKGSRKKNRDKSDLDWNIIFEIIGEIRDDIKEHFPYRVIHVDRAEADDVIAVMCKWTQNNGMIDHGVFEEQQPVLIQSADGDFKQLQKYKNVKQWNPMLKKFVVSKNNKEELIEKICTGDTGDGIPNICSADETLITEGMRQRPFAKKRFAEFYEKGIEACIDKQERQRYERNEKLISFDHIPEDVAQSIINAYIDSKPKGDKMSVMNYLIKHKCRMLLQDLESF